MSRLGVNTLGAWRENWRLAFCLMSGLRRRLRQRRRTHQLQLLSGLQRQSLILVRLSHLTDMNGAASCCASCRGARLGWLPSVSWIRCGVRRWTAFRRILFIGALYTTKLTMPMHGQSTSQLITVTMTHWWPLANDYTHTVPLSRLGNFGL